MEKFYTTKGQQPAFKSVKRTDLIELRKMLIEDYGNCSDDNCIIFLEDLIELTTREKIDFILESDCCSDTLVDIAPLLDKLERGE